LFIKGSTHVKFVYKG